MVILKECRLIIVEEFSTTMIEALYTGIPFIILNNFKSLHSKTLERLIVKSNLIKNNIMFDCPIAAAGFVNENYHNILKWWLSKNVSKSKNILKDFFYNSFFCSRKNFLDFFLNLK